MSKRVLYSFTILLAIGGTVHADDHLISTPPVPESQYIVGMGQGDLSKGRIVCERVAELAARADVAKQIRIQVKEDIRDRIRERSGRDAEQDIEIVREERVSEWLEHVRIVEHNVDAVAGICSAKAMMRKPDTERRGQDVVQ